MNMEKLNELRKQVADQSRERVDIEKFVNIKEVLKSNNMETMKIKVIGAFMMEGKYGKQIVMIDENHLAYSTSQSNVVSFFEALLNDNELYECYFTSYQVWQARLYKSKKFSNECLYWTELENQ